MDIRAGLVTPGNRDEVPEAVFLPGPAFALPVLLLVVRLAVALGEGLLLFVFALRLLVVSVVLEGGGCCWKVVMGSYGTLPSRRLVMVRSTLSVFTGRRKQKLCICVHCNMTLPCIIGQFRHMYMYACLKHT